MRSNLAVLVLLSAVSATLVHAQHQHRTEQSQKSAHSERAQLFAHQMHTGMAKMMKDMHAARPTGNPDVDFLAMMIPHHQGAVEMARLLLIHGRDPLTRTLAEEIIASQTTETAAMKQRLAILRGSEEFNPDDYPALHGTRGE
jgi:uncharacterized protein (DUF305 family)